MIKDYEGPQGSPMMFPHLVGEKVVGVFMYEAALYLVFEGGCSLRLSGEGASNILGYAVVSSKNTCEMFKLKRNGLIPRVAEHAALPPASAFASAYSSEGTGG